VLHFKLLGSAAGGGVPQWNCACPLCLGCRNGTHGFISRLQLQAAISCKPGSWFLINASPDLRCQIEGNSILQPSPRQGRRNTPIRGIILTSADLDQVLGVLLLREFQPLTLYATSVVRQVLESNSFFEMLTRIPNQLTWVEISPNVPFVLDDEITCTPISMAGSLPHYAKNLRIDGSKSRLANIGLIVESGTSRLAYTPSVPEITEELQAIYNSCEVIFVDGTFWSDTELNSTHAGTPLARAIGHIPMSGDKGMIASLSSVKGPHKIFVHINNTNPVLNQNSSEYKYVCEAGWQIGYDGWELK
jgi:pyrroloquinoline quinone biosynthesis protein B